jgi:hypothetical protein
MTAHTQPDIYDLLAEDETKPARTTREACPRCRRVHIYADVIPSGSRFVLHPESWRAAYDGAPSRGTREQADEDMCSHHAEGELVTLGYRLPAAVPDEPPRGGWVRGITSMTPPTVRCEKCGATSTHPRSLLLAIRQGGFTFNPRRPDDRRRLCGTCAWDEWPEERFGDYGTPIPRPAPITTGTTTTPITTKET